MIPPRPVLPPLREVIARHGLIASKALGQNFLFDEQLLARIAAAVDAAAGYNDHIGARDFLCGAGEQFAGQAGDVRRAQVARQGQRDRQAIVGFPAHGSGAQRVQKVFFMKPMTQAMTT